MASTRRDWIEVQVEPVPGEAYRLRLRGDDPERALSLLTDMAATSRLCWWAARPVAARSVAALVAAINRADWERARELVPPTGRLIIDDGRRIAAYDLRWVVATAARALTHRDVDVICCASMTGGRLGLEIVARVAGRRLEVAAEGRVDGPLGRLHDITLEVGAESPLAALLERLAAGVAEGEAVSR
jgi:hypothetical protein